MKPTYQIRYIGCLLGIILFSLRSFGQTYPVQLSVQLVPPYSGYLPDYADPASEKLKIILQFNDFSTPQYNLRLKIEIKGNGFSLVTRQFYNPPPLTLQPGVPILLSGADLAPYLNSANLDFSGLNKSQYEQKMALPEGFYTICVKAYDYYNPGNIQVSNEVCTQAWFTLSDPPFLNMPQCNKSIVPQTPQNIIFQWTPMNLGSPNSAGSTDYEFALWEMRPDSTVDPNQFVLSTAPIYSTTTNLTTLNYGITEPPLNLYMKYVWRVRAKDNTGRDWFKNNGYSQVCAFTYGNAISVLGSALNLVLTAQGVTHRLGKCTWNTQSFFTGYLLQVRKAGTSNWFDYPTTQGTEKVTNLEPNTDYEARVRGESGSVTGDWSNIASFRTNDPPGANCNDQTILNNPLQAVPLPYNKAIAGLIIQTGQFEVVVTEISSAGSLGWYKGKGYAKIFGVLPLAVKFDNIYIDDNNTHLQGTIQALTQGIESWVHQWDVKTAEENPITVNGTIDSVYVTASQVCVILQGNPQPVCQPVPPNQNVIVVRDPDGNQYTIQLTPPPPKVIGPSNYFTFSSDALAASDSMKVTFKASSTQQYGFDKQEYIAWIPNYENIKLNNGKSYFVPYKSIGESQSDEVLADIQIIGFDAAKLSFKTKGGQPLISTSTGSQYKVTVPSGAGVVYAWYNNNKIGKLNVISLKSVSRKLVIVPVNNANINTSNLQTELNKIYKQANVSWSVSVKSNYNLSYDSTNNGLDVDDATLMKKYSQEMRKIKSSYQKFDPDYSKDSYYLFVVSSFRNNGQGTIMGFMPRGRAAGFISENSSMKTIAHELAHGCAALEHTFPQITMNTSNNLMDYNNGVDISKLQWENIQAGTSGFNWRDDEEDALYCNYQSADNITIFETLKLIKRCVNENKTMPVTQFADSYTLNYTTKNAFIAGIQYDWIRIYKWLNGSQKTNISPKNNITSQEKTSYNAGTGQNLPYGEILVDQVFFVEVPANRRVNMELYLKSPESKNLILFVNGYRSNISPTFQEFPNSMNKVCSGDLYNYWNGLDADFMNRIGTKNVVYADGHHDITTSNHLSQEVFLASMATSMSAKLAYQTSGITSQIVLLDTKKNVSGFNTRMSNGRLAGQDMIDKINNGSVPFNKTTDSVDIVAHSMGFAYAQGMIEKLKQNSIKLGRYYIIAPENACSGSVTLSDFEEVWQYGCNELPPNQGGDFVWEQDGVAPQCAVGNCDDRRAYIPKSIPKGFVDSHVISGYKWIFDKKINESGYVKKRY